MRRIDAHINKLNENEQERDRWKLVEFSNLGFIGKLFRCTDLPLFVHIFMMFAFVRPVDLLHYVVLEVIACNPDESSVKQNFK